MTDLRQGFAWWSFEGRGLEDDELIETAADIGYRAVDFLPQHLWRRAVDRGLELTIIDGHMPIEVGFNDPSKHTALNTEVRKAISEAAKHAIPFVAVASGDRSPSTAPDGLAACAQALRPLADEAHASGITLLIEPLNTKVDHPGHECATTQWAVELIERVDSPGLRVLYDAYHAQLMEGDLFGTLSRHWELVAHVHTAGVPGRAELSGLQEIDWASFGRWLASRHYHGVVTHELIPSGPPQAALKQAFDIFAGSADPA